MKTLCLLPLAVLPTAGALWSQGGGQQPATAVFRDSLDSPTDGIRSDGLSGTYGNYPHLTNCVENRVDSQSGFYLLRTAHWIPDGVCTPAV